MCGPFALGIISAGLTVAGGVQQASAARANARFQSRVAEQNATLADAQARDATARGDQAASEQNLRTRQIIASQRAGFASGNVDLDDGTPVEVLGDTALFGQVDEDRIRANAAREAFGFTRQAQEDRISASGARMAGRQQVAGTILGTATSLASIGQGINRTIRTRRQGG